MELFRDQDKWSLNYKENGKNPFIGANKNKRGANLNILVLISSKGCNLERGY